MRVFQKKKRGWGETGVRIVFILHQARNHVLADCVLDSELLLTLQHLLHRLVDRQLAGPDEGHDLRRCRGGSAVCRVNIRAEGLEEEQGLEEARGLGHIDQLR